MLLLPPRVPTAALSASRHSSVRRWSVIDQPRSLLEHASIAVELATDEISRGNLGRIGDRGAQLAAPTTAPKALSGHQPLHTLVVHDHTITGELLGDTRLAVTATCLSVHQPDPLHQIRLGRLGGGRAGRVAFGPVVETRR